LLDGFGDLVLQRHGVERKDDGAPLVAGDFGAQVGEGGTRDFEEEIAVDALRERGQSRLVQ